VLIAAVVIPSKRSALRLVTLEVELTTKGAPDVLVDVITPSTVRVPSMFASLSTSSAVPEPVRFNEPACKEPSVPENT